MTGGEWAPRIVIMEDNPADVLLIREALREQGLPANLVIVHDGEAAIEWASRSHEPAADLILLDLNLPRHNGQEVLTHIRSQPSLSRVPVAVFSSSDSQRDRDEARRLGADRVLVKPCSLDEFLAIGEDIKDMLEAGQRAGASS